MTARGAVSLAHCSLHVESPLHDSEQDPSQRTVQVDPPVHPTLPLGPTVRSHSELPAQVTLHDCPQLPVQRLSLAQLSVQLAPAQPESPRSHSLAAGQVQDVPVQSGGGGPSLPHAPKIRPTTRRQARRREVMS
ncbi:MAG: hypothetical protein IPI49_02185 [Myxococcales bacterium]|nr:hypothetical protein [Myxococcales bacterium]